MDNIEIAINAASKATGVSTNSILSASRKFNIAQGRMITVLLLKEEGMSDEAIGWAIERGRVTVLHTRRVANDLLSCSRVFRSKYEQAYEYYTKQKSLRVS